MFTLTVTSTQEVRIRKYPSRKKAHRGFYNAVYLNPGAKVTLANPEGTVVRIGSLGKTETSSNED